MLVRSVFFHFMILKQNTQNTTRGPDTFNSESTHSNHNTLFKSRTSYNAQKSSGNPPISRLYCPAPNEFPQHEVADLGPKWERIFY